MILFNSGYSCGCRNDSKIAFGSFPREIRGQKNRNIQVFCEGIRKNNDLDVPVVFEEGQKTFDNYMDLKFYLEDLFGREVDLVTERALKPQSKDIIMREVVYA